MSKTNKPNLVISVVYKTERNTWRGFCAPFDVSCEAESKEEAMKIIEDMSDLYIDGLKKYGFPSHLSSRKLSDKNDQLVLSVVLRKVSAKMEEEIRERYFELQQKQAEKESFSLRNPIASGYYFQPVF